jgi:hypothetical protein
VYWVFAQGNMGSSAQGLSRRGIPGQRFFHMREIECHHLVITIIIGVAYGRLTERVSEWFYPSSKLLAA